MYASQNGTDLDPSDSNSARYRVGSQNVYQVDKIFLRNCWCAKLLPTQSLQKEKVQKQVMLLKEGFQPQTNPAYLVISMKENSDMDSDPQEWVHMMSAMDKDGSIYHILELMFC